MATGLAIFLWRYSSVPAAFAGFLFLIFSDIVLYAMMIDLSASCGCFGAFLENQKATPAALTRNLIFACISFLLAFRN